MIVQKRIMELSLFEYGIINVVRFMIFLINMWYTVGRQKGR